MTAAARHPSSYRDPSGFLFVQNGRLYRQVNQNFQQHFNHFIQSGLYQKLVDRGLLIPHQQVENFPLPDEAFQVIEPEYIPFISYPYEWCFDMWKDAALTTLLVAEKALEHQMMLKDASAYNLQRHKGKMMLIDSLSFEIYDEKKPWIAYRQFCEHFLAPLALMHYQKIPLQQLFLGWPDGLPLPLVKKLLPWKSKFNLHSFLHLHLHGGMAAKSKTSNTAAQFSKKRLLNILHSLKTAITTYRLDQPTGVWSGYYNEAAERGDYLEKKTEIINTWVSRLPVKTAVDLGANEGSFSLLLAEKNIFTISADADHYAINRLYQKIKSASISNLHPVIIDLSRPSPALGLNNQERSSFLERAKADLVLALALLHHLCIGSNISFDGAAQLFLQTGRHLILEFIPKSDARIEIMLSQKPDIYDWYSQELFEAAFQKYYSIEQTEAIGSSGRTLYLMKPKTA